MTYKIISIFNIGKNESKFWGLGIGEWGLGPIPNPQSPIPNPHYKVIKVIK